MARQYGADTEKGRDVQRLKESVQNERVHKIHKFNIVLCALLVATGIVSLIICLFARAQCESENIQIIPQIEEQQVLHEKLVIASESGNGAQVSYVEPIVGNSFETGEAVCNLQNDISKYVYKELVRSYAEKGNASDVTYGKEYGDKLLKYRRYISGAKGKMPETWAFDMMDEYVHDNKNNENKSETCPFQWTYSADFTYKGQKIGVAWLCYNTSDPEHILAVVVGNYNSETNLFSDLSLCQMDSFDKNTTSSQAMNSR